MDRQQTRNDALIVEATVRIVKGYVAGNRIPPGGLGPLIDSVASAIRSPPKGEIVSAVPELPLVGSDYRRPQAPARQLTMAEIRDSVQETYLVCFEDGQRYRMLSRHLRLFGLTPDAYRQKWGLPDDYPMMPAADLKHRAELARQRNLWQYDRSTAKPRKKYVYKTKRQTQNVEDPPKPKAYSTDLTRGGWRQQGGVVQGASPG